jgi:plasmid stabilization system protein ParE
MKLIWAASAEGDYLKYLAELADATPAVAARCQIEIETVARRLADRPRIGHMSRWPGLFEWSLVRWHKILVYRIEPRRIVIVAFYDSRRDLAKARPRG